MDDIKTNPVPVDLTLKSIKDIKKSIFIEKSTIGTWVTAVAIHSLERLNARIEISTRCGNLITNDVFNVIKDCVYVSGVSKHDIGLIPVSFRMAMADCNWSHYVPLPLSVVKQHMTELQLATFNKWRNQFRGKSFNIKLIQLINVF